MRRCLSLLTGLRKQEEGGIIIFLAFGLVMLIICIGAAIDMGRAFMVKSRAVAAMDAAVLAAGSEAGSATASELDALAKSYFEANYPKNYLGSAIRDFSIHYNPADQTVFGSIDVSMPTIFGHAMFLNVPEIDMAARTQVTRLGSDKTVEIALALDHSPSMCDPNDTNGIPEYQNPPCTFYNEMTGAVKKMVEEVESRSSVGRVFYAAVPFEQNVKLPNGTILGNRLDSKFFDPNNVVRVSDNPLTMSLDQDGMKIYNALKNRIPDVRGETYTNLGTVGAWMALRPEDKDAFTHQVVEPPIPGDFSDKSTLKIMVLLTDGDNMKLDASDPNNPKMAPNPDADDKQRLFCEDAKKQRIFIMSIVYGDSPSSTIRDIFQECASEPAYYFEARKGDASIVTAFQKVADAILNLQITK